MKYRFYQRLLASLLVVLLAVQLFYWAKEETPAPGAGAAPKETGTEQEDVLTVWYTDPKLNEYLLYAAEQYEAASGTQVVLQLVSAVDYIEHINQASVSEEGNGPDVFVASSDMLEKAAKVGLTVENDSFTAAELKEYFPEKAVHAATYQGQLLAYPFYFETCFLLYNKKYVENVASTMDEILLYADDFDSSSVSMDKMESVLKWNVADIFFNYFFIGNYVDLGGPCGDDREQVLLDADEVIDCLNYYQGLSEFFAIDPELVNTDTVLQEFIDGKIAYSIAKTDAIATLDAAIEAGTVAEIETLEAEGEEAGEAETEADPFFYGIAPLPDLTSELRTGGLSVTNTLVVNAYSENREEAKELARFLSYEKADDLYSMAAKMPVKLGVTYENPEMEILISEYESSDEVPKIMEMSNYWIQMEIAFSNIWTGADAAGEVSRVAESMRTQLAGAN